jgi:hypothetical protein
MQIKNKIQVLAENLRKVTRQKFVAIREGDHKQAQNLHGVQLELDLQASLCLSRSFKKVTPLRLLLNGCLHNYRNKLHSWCNSHNSRTLRK